MKKPVCFLIACFAFRLVALAQAGATNASSTNRVAIALLSMENLSADSNAAHWRTSIPELLDWQLEAIGSTIRLVDSSTIWYAYGELGLSKTNSLTVELARNIGKIAEARYVFWGGYRKTGKNWTVTAQMVQTATGSVSKKWTVTSTNWLSIGNDLVGKIMQFSGITPTAEQKLLMQRPITSSPEALELMLKASADWREGVSADAVGSAFRRVVTLDPKAAKGWYGRAVISANTGKLDEAVEFANKAVSLGPGVADYRNLLGAIYSAKENYVLAKIEFLNAIELDPDDWRNYQRLGEISLHQDRHEEEASYLTKARLLAPYETTVRAELGRAYAELGKVQLAREELRAAEKFHHDDSIECVIGEGYALLNAIPEAAEHYEKYLSFVDKQGTQGQDEEAKYVRTILPNLKERLTPHFINDKAPRAYTPGSCLLS